MKIGVFGCTADPFTCAHYEIVKKVLEDKLVDKVIVLPTIVDYYRKDKAEFFDLAQRRQIIEKWFKNVNNVILDFHEYNIAIYPAKYYDDPEDIHMRRYIHMLEDAQNRYDPTNKNQWFTIIGGDSWNNIDSWQNYQQIFELSKFIVIRRNENKLKDIFLDYEVQDEEGYWTVPNYIITLDKKFKNISASGIRKRLKNECNGINHNNSNYLDLYLSEIEEYLNSGMSYDDITEHIEKIDKELKEKYSMKNENENNDLSEQSDTLLVHTPIFDVIEGKEIEKGFKPIRIKSKNWVGIVVENKEGKIIIENQLRHGLNKKFNEFPCGIIEEGEHSFVAALRELKEEVGINPVRYTMKYLGKYAANPAFMTNYMHYYYIKLDEFEQFDQKLDVHEHITWKWIDKEEAFEDYLKNEGSALLGNMWMLLIKNGILTTWND